MKASVNDRKYKGINLLKGQLITSRKLLSEQTKLSEQQVRTCLQKLEKSKEIEIFTTKKYTIITIKSWTIYQKNNQPTNNQVITS
jgi:biotin operon repressor